RQQARPLPCTPRTDRGGWSLIALNEDSGSRSSGRVLNAHAPQLGDQLLLPPCPAFLPIRLTLPLPVGGGRTPLLVLLRFLLFELLNLAESDLAISGILVGRLDQGCGRSSQPANGLFRGRLELVQSLGGPAAVAGELGKHPVVVVGGGDGALRLNVAPDAVSLDEAVGGDAEVEDGPVHGLPGGLVVVQLEVLVDTTSRLDPEQIPLAQEGGEESARFCRVGLEGVVIVVVQIRHGLSVPAAGLVDLA